MSYNLILYSAKLNNIFIIDVEVLNTDIKLGSYEIIGVFNE